jgi:hypothetical protein
MITDILESIRPRSMLDIVPREVYQDAIDEGFGWATVQYAYYWAICRLFRPRSIFEIGVGKGGSMGAMLLGAGERAVANGWDMELYWPGSNAVAAKKMIQAGVLEKQFVLENRNSRNEAGLPNMAYDLVHVDGDHSYDGATHDLEIVMWFTKTILFDDYLSIEDCKRACDDFIARATTRGQLVYHELIPTHNGLMLIKL